MTDNRQAEIDPWVLAQWAKAGLTHSVRLPCGHIVHHLSQQTVDTYVQHRGAEQVS